MTTCCHKCKEEGNLFEVSFDEVGDALMAQHYTNVHGIDLAKGK